MLNLEAFTILSDDSILSALKKIDQNRKGFLLVVGRDNTLIGTLTDGDIRRAFIAGTDLNAPIDRYFNQKYVFINNTTDFGQIIDIFKNPKIKFLPIVDENKKLVNLMTKANMHQLILEDISFDLSYDFMSMDESTIEHEIFNRPWGIYKTTFINPYSQSKIIKVNPGEVLSLQKHSHREEHWVVISGQGEVTLDETIKKIESGSFVFIPKGCVHRLRNTSTHQALFVSEVQLGDYFGEDDIYRIDDVYGRI